MDKKDKLVRPVTMLRAMKQKVFQLLQAESKMTLKERECQQWQLLFQIKGVGDFLVGKGGVNTMFYTVNGGERKLLLPADMLTKIDAWIVKASVKTYAVVHNKQAVKRNLSTIREAKQVKPKVGYAIYSVENGKRVKLFEYKKGVLGNAYIPVKEKS